MITSTWDERLWWELKIVNSVLCFIRNHNTTQHMEWCFFPHVQSEDEGSERDEDEDDWELEDDEEDSDLSSLDS